MKKRCEVSRGADGWQVAFFADGGHVPIVRVFEREDQALLAVSAWCGSQRERGHDVELSLPPQDGRASR